MVSKYRISGNFSDDLIFAITFTSQNIQYTEILSGIVCCKKLFKLHKMTDTN